MKLVLYTFQSIGILIIGMGGYHIYKARQIEGMGALGAGFLGAIEIAVGGLTIIISALVFWIQKWRVSRKLNK
ncbi:hypothetical protein [Paenibacillus xylanilyticus]|uniref:hypothetical protein n=1 Tax=Paenibacillus xylanilyticus TaxID=248903 RepID=UPI00399F7C04